MSLYDAAERWLPRPRRGGDEPVRLFCLPYAGAGATIFRRWAEQFPPSIALWPIHLPGREGRLTERPFTDIASLVADLADALGPYLDRPYALFGHSMGGLISFELARHLERIGRRTPSRLFVSASRAPQLTRRGEQISALPDDELVAAVRRMAGTPERVLQDPELVELMLLALRADFELIETYRYRAGAPLACPIAAFGGVSDDIVWRSDLAGWAEQTSGPFTLHMLPGSHFFLADPVARPALLQLLARELTPLAGRSPALAPSSFQAALSGL
jgi:surfactin synthase thioesterase subunit